MKNRTHTSKSGITIIELVVAMLLVGIVGLLSGTIILFVTNTTKVIQNEYSLQFSTRMVLAETSKIIRYSTAVFTIPKSSFRADNLCAEWDYIGINNVVIKPSEGGRPAVIGNEIVRYVYNPATNSHNRTVLMTGSADVSYQFSFKKINPEYEDSLLQFTIDTIPVGSVDSNGKPRAQLTITSEVEARNSLQVIDMSTALDPAYAIAFKLQPRGRSVVGHVSMVLDTSGSMAWNMSGQEGRVPTRLSILKTEANTLIDAFAQEENIDINLVPFETTANNPSSFYNASNSTASLKSLIANLTADGGTNTGDGLRRAYWNLKNNRLDATGAKAQNYVIILVDGVTTFGSVISNSNRNYFFNDGNVNSGYLDRTDPFSSTGQIVGNGSSLDAKGTAYVNAIGALIKAKDAKNEPFAKVYVIGFSSLASDLASVDNIAAACGATSDAVFTAGSQDDLNQVFTAIRKDIFNDLWYLQGPTL